MMTLYIRWFALATLMAGSLSASVLKRIHAHMLNAIASPLTPHVPPQQVPDQDGTGATDRTLMFSSMPDPNHDPNPPSWAETHCGDPRPCDVMDTPGKPGKAIVEMNAGLTEPRERKEWREMSDAEIDKFACAIHVMDNKTTRELRACYGNTSWAFADLVNLHACAASDPRGDQGHRSPSFMLFHKSFVRTFEMAILSIDPTIGAIPWWNMPLDSAPVLDLDGKVKVSAGKYYCPTNTTSPPNFGSKFDDPKMANLDMGNPPRQCDPKKYIWSDAFFGKQLGSGPNFEVEGGGRWANRKLHRYGDFDHEYWKHTETEHGKVTNECVDSKWFSPRSPIVGDLRKLEKFDGNLDQNCVRCCEVLKEGNDPTCKCDQPGDLVDVYMRGPTLDTQTCSPYVTRNPNGRGFGTAGPNGTGARSRTPSSVTRSETLTRAPTPTTRTTGSSGRTARGRTSSAPSKACTARLRRRRASRASSRRFTPCTRRHMTRRWARLVT